jgi:hypothetical protein
LRDLRSAAGEMLKMSFRLGAKIRPDLPVSARIVKERPALRRAEVIPGRYACAGNLTRRRARQGRISTPSLSDEELDIVFNLARPLERELRDAFLRAVATELERYEPIGPGIVFRVGKQLQRDFFRPPLTHDGFNSKYARSG